jgi:cell wall-associated NlpC family hydrolase
MRQSRLRRLEEAAEVIMNAVITAPGRLDPRRNAYREDIAAIGLKDQVKAQRYVQGELRQVVAAAAPMRYLPRFDAPLLTEALVGDLATIYDVEEGWGWAQLGRDGYVGYLPLDTLSMMIEEPTHWLIARASFVYPFPDMKRPPLMRLSFGAEVTVIGREGRFYELSRGGFVFAGHLQPVDERAKDFVRLAERFVGTPYLWGGRTSQGIDCSGLVQVSLQGAGLKAPRDSDMQEGELGEKLPTTGVEGLKRGDLIFWKGHVGVAQSSEWMLHASGHQMEVVVEPVNRAIERLAATHGNVTTIRRIPGLDQPDARA